MKSLLIHSFIFGALSLVMGLIPNRNRQAKTTLGDKLEKY